MSDDTGADQPTPWTDAGRARVRAAAQTLSGVLAAHAGALAEAGPDDAATVADADAVLLSACQEYADAQWELTARLSPLWPIEDEDEEPVGSDPFPGAPPVDASPAGDVEPQIVAVAHRHDYLLQDAAAVIEAGRRAYVDQLAPGESPDVDADVATVGQAMHQVVHASGIDALRTLAGLEPVVGLTVYLDLPLTAEDEADDEDGEVELPEELVPFLLTGEVLFAAQELYRPDVRLLE
ncbi:hypothetical protein [Solicola sp. PLA-1-18]|uniref:hypothetical protein n=1 Tax=Solicola sp. PLA-1-18 TaxID=3380532 RepID=UPI003B7BD835